MAIKEQLKFYADTPAGEKNKFFCYNGISFLNHEEKLKDFIKKGFIIKAAYLQTTNEDTGEIKNIKISNLQYYYDLVLTESNSKR